MGGKGLKGKGVPVSNWAQCDNDRCQKWRRLPPGTKVDPDVPWFCYMNPDELRSSCEAPEESYNEDVEDMAVEISSDEGNQPFSPGGGAVALSGKGAGGGGGRRGGAKRGRGRGRRGGRGRGGAAAAERRQSGVGEEVRWASQKRPLVKDEDESDEDEEEDWEDQLPDAKRQRSGTGSGQLHQHLNGHGRGSGSSMSAHAGMALAWQPHVAQQHQAAAPAQAPRGTAKARKACQGFEKLLAAGGLWESKARPQTLGRGRSISVPPQWVWEGFAQFAPEAAELACRGLDLAAAERYFDASTKGTDPEHAEAVAATARLGLILAAAAAADAATGSLAATAPPAAFPPPDAAGRPPLQLAAAMQLPPTALALPSTAAAANPPGGVPFLSGQPATGSMALPAPGVRAFPALSLPPQLHPLHQLLPAAGPPSVLPGSVGRPAALQGQYPGLRPLSGAVWGTLPGLAMSMPQQYSLQQQQQQTYSQQAPGGGPLQSMAAPAAPLQLLQSLQPPDAPAPSGVLSQGQGPLGVQPQLCALPAAPVLQPDFPSVTTADAASTPGVSMAISGGVPAAQPELNRWSATAGGSYPAAAPAPAWQQVAAVDNGHPAPAAPVHERDRAVMGSAGIHLPAAGEEPQAAGHPACVRAGDQLQPNAGPYLGVARSSKQEVTANVKLQSSKNGATRGEGPFQRNNGLHV